MKPTTLLIMAAGIGSRIGAGIEQLNPVGIHDAIEAGFNKIVFVIRPDIEADFKERIGNRRIEAVCERHGVEVAYTFQDIHSIPGEFPQGRTKPQGTGQAVLSAKSLIHEPFAVINADDYYGKNAFKVMYDWLIFDHAENAIAMAGFILKNTLSEHGGVTRGVCKVAEGHTHVIDVVETSNIVKTVDDDTGAIDAEADGVVLDPESYVSMNFWGFPATASSDPWYMSVLGDGFTKFFKTTVPINPLKVEYLLPTHIGGFPREEQVTVKVLEKNDKWSGVTYQEDKAAVVASIRNLIQASVYTEDLYSDL